MTQERPPVPFLNQLHPVPMTPSNFLKFHLNIILQSTTWSPQWPLSLRLFPHTICVQLYPPPYAPQALPIAFVSILPPAQNWEGVQIIQLLVMQLSPFPCHLVPLRSKYSPQHPILKHPQPAFLPQCQRPGFIPIQNHRKNYSSIYLNL